MRLEEERINSENAFDGGFLHIRKDTVLLPDGKEGKREYVVHPGAVAVVALSEDGSILLEHQFRYPVGETLIEIPSGILDKKDKTPLDAAKRELEEETGYQAEEWISLGELLPLAGYSSERTFLFLAKGLQETRRHLDDDEFIEIFSLPFPKAVQMVLEGEITDGNTQITILKAKAYLDGLMDHQEA